MKYSLRLLRLFPLLLALPACQHAHHSEDKHAHSEEEQLSLSAYGSRIELFAEADPFVAGEESHLHIFLTRLEDFKPVDSAEVRIRLNEKVFSCFKSPQKDFCFTGIVPQKAGEDTLHVWVDIAGCEQTDTLSVPIHVYEDEHDAHRAMEEGKPMGLNTVSLPKVMGYRIDFATEPILLENVEKTIATTALISPLPSTQNVISAKSGGIVAFNGIGIVEGMHVEKGDVLFFIEDGLMIEKSMKTYYERIRNEYRKTKQEYERKKALLSKKIVSESAFLEAETAYRNAKVEYDNLQINASDNRRAVYAPATGFIETLLVENGQYVEAGQSLLVIHQGGGRHLLSAEVAAIYHPFLKNIRTANLKTLNGKRTYSLEELNGKLLAYGQCAKEGSPLLPLSFEIDIAPDIVPGTFVNLYVKTSGEQKSLSVANTAIIEESGNYFVFVQLTPEVFDKRPVSIGVSDGFRTEIEAGLREGDRVVSKGAQILNLRQEKGSLDPHAGHNH